FHRICHASVDAPKCQSSISQQPLCKPAQYHTKPPRPSQMDSFPPDSRSRTA
ncbi:hypothetical protein WMY93_034275, partial [Mugilogobius chulae]